MGAAWLNLLLWLAAEWRRPEAVPHWVRRLLVSCAFLFVTWGGVLAALQDEEFFVADSPPAQPTLALLALIAAMSTTVAVALRRREDIYPLAMVMGSFIVVSLVWIARIIDSTNEAMFLLFALYLIAVSTMGGRWLLALLRRWRLRGSA